jgi:Mn-dependent DtxR family transcriptional regulator
MKVRDVKARALALVLHHPAGVRSSTVSIVLGVSWATASSTLARLYWDARVDRHREGGAFVYTPRPEVRRAVA